MALVGLGVPEANARNAEAQDILDWALTHPGQTISHHGKFWNFDNLTVVPTPLQQPSPPRWTTVVTEESARRSARRATKICTGFSSVADVTKVFDGYREEAGRAGFAVSSDCLGLRRVVNIALDEAEARALSARVYNRFAPFFSNPTIVLIMALCWTPRRRRMVGCRSRPMNTSRATPWPRWPCRAWDRPWCSTRCCGRRCSSRCSSTATTSCTRWRPGRASCSWVCSPGWSWRSPTGGTSSSRSSGAGPGASPSSTATSSPSRSARVAERLGQFLSERQLLARAVGWAARVLAARRGLPLRLPRRLRPDRLADRPARRLRPRQRAGGDPHHAVGPRRHRGRAHPDARRLRRARRDGHPGRPRMAARQLLAAHPGRRPRVSVVRFSGERWASACGTLTRWWPRRRPCDGRPTGSPPRADRTP